MPKHIFIDPKNTVLQSGHVVQLNRERSNYVSKVLRARKGDSFVVFDGCGEAYSAIVEVSLSGKTKLSLREPRSVPDKEGDLILLISIINRGLEDLIQKSTELGVTHIILASSARSQKKNPRLERLRKVIVGACEQSQRMWLPKLETRKDMAKVFQTLSCDQKLIGDTGISEPTTIRPQNTCLAIGPEGGWTEGEINLAKQNGFKAIGLGSLTLRSTTAAIVALGLIRNANQWERPVV